MSDIQTKKIGAGGFWEVIDEKQDSSVVRQKTPLSCVAAVGEMLLRRRGIAMTQEEIIDIIGEASTTEKLARLLNEIEKTSGDLKWHGTIVAVRHLEKIIDKDCFGAVLREGSALGHLVLVAGLKKGLLTVNDPWDGTSYRMTVEEFLKVWNGELIFRWNLSE